MLPVFHVTALTVHWKPHALFQSVKFNFLLSCTSSMIPLNSVGKKKKKKKIHAFVTWSGKWIEKNTHKHSTLFQLVSIESDLVHYTGNETIFVAGPINKQLLTNYYCIFSHPHYLPFGRRFKSQNGI